MKNWREENRRYLSVAYLIISIIFLVGCSGTNVDRKNANRLPDVNSGERRTANFLNRYGNTEEHSTEKGWRVDEVELELKTNNLVFYEDMALFKYNGKYGYIDKSGRVSIDAIYEDAGEFKDGIAFVAGSGTEIYAGRSIYSNYSFIDKKGNKILIIPDDASKVSRRTSIIGDDYIRFTLPPHTENDFHYFTMDGEILSYNPEIVLESSIKTVIEKKLSDKDWIEIISFFDKEDVLVIEYNTDISSERRTMVDESVFYKSVVRNSKVVMSWIFDLAGNIILESSEILSLERPSDGMIAFCKYGRWGYCDYSGNVVIEPQYDEVKDFTHGYAVVKEGHTWMLIDKNNDILMNLPFSSDWCRFKIYDNNILYVTLEDSERWIIYCALLDMEKIANGQPGVVIYKAPTGFGISYTGDSVFTVFNDERNEDVKMFTLERE